MCAESLVNSWLALEAVTSLWQLLQVSEMWL